MLEDIGGNKQQLRGQLDGEHKRCPESGVIRPIWPHGRRAAGKSTLNYVNDYTNDGKLAGPIEESGELAARSTGSPSMASGQAGPAEADLHGATYRNYKTTPSSCSCPSTTPLGDLSTLERTACKQQMSLGHFNLSAGGLTGAPPSAKHGTNEQSAIPCQASPPTSSKGPCLLARHFSRVSEGTRPCHHKRGARRAPALWRGPLELSVLLSAGLLLLQFLIQPPTCPSAAGARSAGRQDRRDNDCCHSSSSSNHHWSDEQAAHSGAILLAGLVARCHPFR